VGAHRIAYWLGTGKAPGDLQVGHTCHQRLCQNPAHLFAGTCSQIQGNRVVQRNNACGARGVYWHRNRWVAQVRHNGQKVHAGSYTTLEEAAAAAARKRAELFKTS
jgi:hypothetical protein